MAIVWGADSNQSMLDLHLLRLRTPFKILNERVASRGIVGIKAVMHSPILFFYHRALKIRILSV